MDDLKALTNEQLISKRDASYLEYMYQECSERNYDFQASNIAWDEYIACVRELDAREGEAV